MAARWIEWALLGVLALVAMALALLHAPPAPLWPDARQLCLAVLAGVGYLALFLVLPWARHAQTGDGDGDGGDHATATDADTVVVLHASQTGFAQQLAGDTAAQLRRGGRPARTLPLQAFDAARLGDTATVLLVLSTTGEGDPPDAVSAMAEALFATRPDLSALSFGLLALGDRRYTHFCRFGRQVHAWLEDCGACAMFDRIEVDQGDADALRSWHERVGTLGRVPVAPLPTPPRHEAWVLRSRVHTNPGSPGAPVFALALDRATHEGGPAPSHWRAGDIVQVVPGPPEAPFAPFAPGHREYSIASAPHEGVLRLLVRQVRDSEGRLGPGSGWLTEHLRPGQSVALRIRANPGFRLEPSAAPLVLIGNGTGLAGLRAHLAQRVASGQRRNWLLFGERDPTSDLHFDQDILAWEADGFIEHLDLVFSRAGTAREYVQRRLATEAGRLRAWVDAGATVLVCGSVQGMAPGVHAVMENTLGAQRVRALAEAGRYRRDVY